MTKILFKQVATEWNYLWQRRGIEFHSKSREGSGVHLTVSPLPSLWGSKTEAVLDIRKKNESFHVNLAILGETIQKRLENIKAHDSIELWEDEEGLFWFELSDTITDEEIKNLFNYSVREFELVKYLQENIPGEILAKGPERGTIIKGIECFPHDCERSGCDAGNRSCPYTDWDGRYRGVDFHVTCDGVVQVY